jgi:HYDIN/CFA65/VesB-like, Ig-like domain
MHVELAILRCLAAGLFLAGLLCISGCAGVASTTASAASPASGAYDGPISVSATRLNFGDVRVGATHALDVTFGNPGKTSVTLSQEAVVGRGFTTTGVGSNLILEPGQSADLAVSFRPAAAGSASGSVTLSTTLSGKPITILLVGNGVPASAHSVRLSWNPGNSTVIRYRVYRKQSGEKYGQVSTAVVRTTSYTDTAVEAGQTYSYAVTAVGVSSKESAFSNAVSVAIPSP